MNTTSVAQDGMIELDDAKFSKPGWFKISPRVILSYAALLLIAVAYLGPLLMLFNTTFLTNREFNRNATQLPGTLSNEGYEESWDDRLFFASEIPGSISFEAYEAPWAEGDLAKNTRNFFGYIGDLFSNYTTAWEQGDFAQLMLNSVFYAFSATTLYVFTAVFVAFPVARGYIKGGGIVFTLFLIALFLPPALIPQFQLMLGLDLYNTRLGYILLLVVNPVGIIIMVNYLRSLPRELDEAAAMDGCGYVRFMFYIVFPLSRPVIATVVVLHAIGIWNEVILATIYLTDESKQPITRGLLEFQGQYGSAWPVLASAVTLMAIPMIILFLFLQRYIISGLTQGAVKS